MPCFKWDIHFMRCPSSGLSYLKETNLKIKLKIKIKLWCWVGEIFTSWDVCRQFFLLVVRLLRWEEVLSFLPSCIPIWLRKLLVLVSLLWTLCLCLMVCMLTGMWCSIVSWTLCKWCMCMHWFLRFECMQIRSCAKGMLTMTGLYTAEMLTNVTWSSRIPYE